MKTDKIPRRIKLFCRKDANGHPIPFFLDCIDDNVPDYRFIDARKINLCILCHLCWTCKRPLVAKEEVGFVLVDPANVIDRFANEPPHHVDCAAYAASHWPITLAPLTQDEETVSPYMKAVHHSGLICVWIVRHWKYSELSKFAYRFTFENASRALWFLNGKEIDDHECLRTHGKIPILKKRRSPLGLLLESQTVNAVFKSDFSEALEVMLNGRKK